MIVSGSSIALFKRVTGIVFVALALAGAGCHSSTPPTTPTTPTTPATPAPQVTLTPAALSFTTQTFDMPGMTQQVVVSNSGTDTLVISTISAFGNFTETDNCINSFAVGESCTINVTFVNTSAGSSGGVNIYNNTSTSPQTVTITGPAVTAPAAVLSSSSVLFPSQAVGTTSGAQTIALTNPLNGFAAPLAISSIVTVGDYAIAGQTCGSSLNAASSCTITVTFTPTGTGQRTGFVTVFDNAAGGAQSAALNGIGR